MQKSSLIETQQDADLLEGKEKIRKYPKEYSKYIYQDSGVCEFQCLFIG